mgnify:CR=1 FL=1
MFAHTDAVQLFSVTKPPRVRLQFALLLVRLLAFAAIVVSSGCTTLIPTLIPTLIQDTEQGSWVDIAPGSSLTLNQDIRIAQDRARVFLLTAARAISAPAISPPVHWKCAGSVAMDRR